MIDEYLEKKSNVFLFTEEGCENFDEDYSILELNESLKKLNKKLAPGIDKISN